MNNLEIFKACGNCDLIQQETPICIDCGADDLSPVIIEDSMHNCICGEPSRGVDELCTNCYQD